MQLISTMPIIGVGSVGSPATLPITTIFFPSSPLSSGPTWLLPVSRWTGAEPPGGHFMMKNSLSAAGTGLQRLGFVSAALVLAAALSYVALVFVLVVIQAVASFGQ